MCYKGRPGILYGVAPHAGAWIEIYARLVLELDVAVAPHAGAWIEIPLCPECLPALPVAPHAGAWIEIIRR